MKNKILLSIVIILFLILIVVIHYEHQNNYYFPMPSSVKNDPNPLTVRLLNEQTNDITTVNMEDYIIGVVSAEMPATFEEEALKAEEAANALFAGNGSMENIPSVESNDNIGILDAIILSGFAPSKGQAKTLIAQGGITINDEKISDQNLILSAKNFEKDIILKKGKKNYCKIILKNQ